MTLLQALLIALLGYLAPFMEPFCWGQLADGI